MLLAALLAAVLGAGLASEFYLVSQDGSVTVGVDQATGELASVAIAVATAGGSSVTNVTVNGTVSLDGCVDVVGSMEVFATGNSTIISERYVACNSSLGAYKVQVQQTLTSGGPIVVPCCLRVVVVASRGCRVCFSLVVCVGGAGCGSDRAVVVGVGRR
jgi:hypothetical protein